MIWHVVRNDERTGVRLPPTHSVDDDHRIQNQVLGHANAGMDAHYFDAIPLKELHRQLSKVQYDYLDLSNLVRPPFAAAV